MLNLPLPNDLPEFGQRLKWVIANTSEIGTQAKLAESMGVSRAYIAQLAKRAAPPGKDKVAELSQTLHVPESWLAYGVALEGGVNGADLARQIDAVNNGPGTEWVKAWRVAEIAAAYRARALEREAEAATARAVAVQMAETRAHERWVSSHQEGWETASQGDAAFGRNGSGGEGDTRHKPRKRKGDPPHDETEPPGPSSD